MKPRRNNHLSLSSASFSSTNTSPVDGSDVEQGRFLLLPPRLDEPALPSPLLKHAQQMEAKRPVWRRYIGLFVSQAAVFSALCAVFFVWRCFVVTKSIPLPSPFSLRPTFYGHLEASSLSQEAEPIVFQDSKGRKGWTVHIPQSASFPLHPGQYKDICFQSRAVSRAVSESGSTSGRKLATIVNTPQEARYVNDPNYLDVQEAIRRGIFNDTTQTPIPVVGRDPQIELPAASPESKTCERSLTFILETEDAGFGKSLLSLWLSYSIARHERRAFFIDDSRWQYGSYLSFFPKPPQPSCAPPSASHIVPCPHQAAHLAVSSATLSWAFGPTFYARGRNQKDIFRMAREGYQALYSLATEDAAYAKERVEAVQKVAKDSHYPVIGVHVRRGDRHPFEYAFQRDYLPLARYTEAATRILDSLPRPKPANESETIPLLVASDNPDIVSDPDWAEARATFELERAQDRIVLASKSNFAPATPLRPGNGAFIKHVDEVSGWEGGFFASLFRGLGRPNHAEYLTFSSAQEHRQQADERLRNKQGVQEMSEEERKAEENAAAMRHLVGRGYLLDLEVLRSSDAVVCGISSATCRVLAVMMGWDKVKSGQWVNVDDGRHWSWDGTH